MNWKLLGFSTVIAVVAYVGFSASKPAASVGTLSTAIIPKPAALDPEEGSFLLAAGTTINVPADQPELLPVAKYLSDKLRVTTGLNLVVVEGGETQEGIRLTLAKMDMAKEGYSLHVGARGADIIAATPEGFFYGALSLWQLAQAAGEGEFAMPFVSVSDEPRMAWRGAMLDVSRHFRSVDFVKDFIDWMAVHKMNVFHWHLTDDQGWRIEIKKYPKLTEVGAWRVPAGAAPKADIDPATGEPRLYGGYYTQDQVREVVAYAAERFITVMPEIDLPGHASAAVAAYPQFGTEPVAEVSSDWGIYYSTFNLEDETIAFLEDVMDETLALFPSKFVHIGGDEVSTKQWENSARIKERMEELGIEDVHEIQSYFTRHFANYLAERGRRLIGWDEILEGGSIADSAIMSWRGTKGGVEAAKAGRQVVMAPSPIYYTDYRQSYMSDEPPGREHVQTLEDIYNFDPLAGLSEEETEAVLGAQVTVFTEHMRTEARVEHMAFPRMLALAETVWSPEHTRDYQDFAARLMPHMARLRALGLAPADSAYAVQFDAKPDAGGQVRLEMKTQSGLGDIRYTLGGVDPSATSPLYDGAMTLPVGETVSAAAFYGVDQLSKPRIGVLSERAFLRREDDELTLCSAALAIKLDDDYPKEGNRANFLIDIVEPCWIYENPIMEGVTGLEVSVGNLPYNFQIGDLISSVKLAEPETDTGEIVVYKDVCDGEELARLPLAPATASFGVTTLEGVIKPAPDAKALCFRVAANHYEPLWAIDWVQLTKGE